jgi:type IV pilus assembly protein PilW
MLGFAAQLIVDQRKQFVLDRARSQASQTLRAAMDLVGNDIRQAGENVNDDNLPVVSVADNTAPNQGQVLVVQRKELIRKLYLCENIQAGSNKLFVDTETSGCNSSVADDFPDWRNVRCHQDIDNDDPCSRNAPLGNASACEEKGGTDKECAWAYIYDPGNKRGDFFLTDYEDFVVTSVGTKAFLTRVDGTGWTNPSNYASPNNYASGIRPAIYLLEEHEYRLVSDNETARSDDYALELTINRQDNKQRLVNNLSNFRVEVQLPTGPAGTSFNFVNGIPTYVTNWRPIQQIKITLNAVNYPETPSNQALPSGIKVPNANLTLESQFFPRNSLSNLSKSTP